MAAAEIIQAYHKETVGIDHLTGADTGVPPARALVLHAVVARRMMVTGQGMTDQHRVGRVAVQGAVGFINQLVGRQGTATLQFERGVEMVCLWLYQTHGICGDLLRHDDSLT